MEWLGTGASSHVLGTMPLLSRSSPAISNPSGTDLDGEEKKGSARSRGVQDQKREEG